jgi:hypothetical protein
MNKLENKLLEEIAVAGGIVDDRFVPSRPVLWLGKADKEPFSTKKINRKTFDLLLSRRLISFSHQLGARVQYRINEKYYDTETLVDRYNKRK